MRLCARDFVIIEITRKEMEIAAAIRNALNGTRSEESRDWTNNDESILRPIRKRKKERRNRM